MTGQDRERLPQRRPSETFVLSHGGHEFSVTVGYSLDGRPLEVFAGGSKIGTDVGHILADACVVISLALQHGACPVQLARSLLRVPDLQAGEEGATVPASIVGRIVEALEAARELPGGGGSDA